MSQASIITALFPLGGGIGVLILGALMEKAPVVSNEILGEAIRIELGEKKAKFLEGNIKALEAGEAAARG